MSEMNPISRFFVNLSSARRSERRYRWIRENATIPTGAICLEIGCGSGQLAVRFVDGFHPSRYLATDIDPRQLEEARKVLHRRYPSGPPTVLELRPADMLGLSFPDRSFDVVLAFVAIHHANAQHLDFTNVPRALAEIDRVLRPAGLLLYSELFHQERIRGWLAEHGYSLLRIQRGFRLESVVARKPTPPP